MRKISTILILSSLLICSSTFSQADSSRNYFFQVQPFTGFGKTSIIEYIERPPMYPESSFWYSTLGMEAKFMIHLKDVNIGLGSSVRYAGTYFHFKFKEILNPSFFGIVELGNSNHHTPLSLAMNIGIMKGTMSNKYLGFVSIGPKFNTGKYHRKINVSLSPFLTFHQNETVELSGFNPKPNIPYSFTYNVIYKSISINLALIIELNKFKTKHNKS